MIETNFSLIRSRPKNMKKCYKCSWKLVTILNIYIFRIQQMMGDFELLNDVPGSKAILKVVLKSQIQLLVSED